MGRFAFGVEFLFDLDFLVELSDHIDDSNEVGLWLPCGLVDGPSNPLNKVLGFSILAEPLVKNLFNGIHFFIRVVVFAHGVK